MRRTFSYYYNTIYGVSMVPKKQVGGFLKNLKLFEQINNI